MGRIKDIFKNKDITEKLIAMGFDYGRGPQGEIGYIGLSETGIVTCGLRLVFVTISCICTTNLIAAVCCGKGIAIFPKM